MWMKTHALAVVCAIALPACQEQAADALPPLSTIQEATLAYANCVDKTARNFAVQPGRAEVLAQSVIDSCQELRSQAIDLKAVPVMFSTVAEFDAMHFGVARQSIETSRAKQ